MTDVSHKGFTAESFFAGALLLFCALTFYYFSVLRIDYHKTALLDLGPYPDAAEYFAQAKALLEDKWPSIQIGYDKLPSRYPPGYPALMLPWLKALPEAQSVLAPFRTNQTLLRVPRDAVIRWVRGTFARHAAWFLHFLSFLNERSEHISAHCTSIHVHVLGT